MKLTQRQKQVVRLLADGLSCPEVARRLAIALPTVRQHVRDVAKALPGDLPALRRVRQCARDLLAA